MRQIYLDYNATTPVAEPVCDAIIPFLREHFGNPSSGHALGRACAEAISESRECVAALLGASPDEIVFTGCGTESNNLALRGVMSSQPSGHLIISAIEHPAIVEPAMYLRSLGYEVSIAQCDEHGIVSPETVESLFRDDTVLVSIMHSNNEIGTLQPIAQIADLCHRNNILVHTDAAQSIGKVRVNVDELDIDLLTIAGHKLYAPKGIGALFVKNGIRIEPVVRGAGHEFGVRPGTENTPYIVGLGRAAAIAIDVLDESAARMEQLRDLFEKLLIEEVGAGLSVNGRSAERLPNTLSVNFPSVSGHELVSRIPEICASTGAACRSGEVSLSATLKAIGLNEETARGTVRLSLGRETTEDEVRRAASLLVDHWEKVR